MSEVKAYPIENSAGIESGSTLTCENPKSDTNNASAGLENNACLPDALMTQKSIVMPAPLSAPNPPTTVTKTIRLNLELFATNSNSYPEFNYSKLVHLQKKKQKKLQQKLNCFPIQFDDNDEDVARIAKELERKYGSSYGSGRGKSKKDDHCDIGLGYDETDDFIDNTEPYDEVIPEEVETVEGGFYINSGALEFKKLSLGEKTEEIIKMPRKTKKRSAHSSDDSSSSTEGEDDIVRTEKRQKSDKSDVKNDKEREREREKQKDKNDPSIHGLSSNSPKPNSTSAMASDLENEKNRLKTVKTTTVKDMLKAKRDNFLKMQEHDPNSNFSKTSNANVEVKGSSNTSNYESSGDETSDSTRNNSDSNKSENQKKIKTNVAGDEGSEKYRSTDTKLPNLSKELMDSIQKLKDLAKEKNYIGKKFQFDDQITEIFFRIDNSCLSLEKTHRNMIFAHLEYNLSLTKYYLLRKAKQLRVKDEKSKLKRTLAKLRKSVEEVMPNILNVYDQELKKFTEYQSTISNIPSMTHVENAPKPPKKKFIWNEIIRNLLYDVYQVRLISYSILGTRKESLEDFIKNFLKDKVLTIWPSGWMKLEELIKEIEKRKNNTKKLKDKKVNQSSSGGSVHTLPAPTNCTALDIEMHEDNRTMIMSGVRGGGNGSGQNSTSDIEANIRFNEKSTQIKNQIISMPPSITIENIPREIHQVNHHQMNMTEVTNKSLGPAQAIDLASPSKQRTDHSITNIISSPSSSCSSTSTTPQPMQYMQQPLLQQQQQQQQQQHYSSKGSTNTTKDNQQNLFKSANDIMSTSTGNQQLTTNDFIAINEIYGNSAHANLNRQRENSSSESDGVEIVGVFPPATRPISLNKNKYRKNGNGSPCATPNIISSSSSASNSRTKPINFKHKNSKKSSSVNKMPIECSSSGFDANKVANVLKELQELEKLQKHSNIFNNFKDINQ